MCIQLYWLKVTGVDAIEGVAGAAVATARGPEYTAASTRMAGDCVDAGSPG